jgi:acyl-CoA reductase-like NAD-dependent aldehyde dehydrogenase
MTRTVLELSGNNAVVVHSDADVAQVLPFPVS